MEHAIKQGLLYKTVNGQYTKCVCFPGRAGSVEGEAYCTSLCAAFELMSNQKNIHAGYPAMAVLHCCKREVYIKEISE